ncbi:MAG TPA: FTR1 family protein [Gemmatimonadota bacterium]|jgi:high-affinity iron transporter
MGTSASVFLQSLVIIGREGLEAMLIVGAMLAVLRRVDPGRGAGALWGGVAAGVGASLVTATLVQAVFHSSHHVELLEGLTLLTATVVLLWVGHWLLAKSDVARWKAYLERRVRRGVGAGSALALGLVSFLAVYREGVETVLFYRALLSAEDTQAGAVMAGLAVGLVALALVCWVIFRFGARMPLRPFFAGTSALLLLLAFAFAGKGVHELQEAGRLSESGLALVRIPSLGIYPTVENVVAQAGVLCAIALPMLVRAVRGRAPSPVEAGAAETLAGRTG